MQVSSHDTISHRLAADVANAATFNVPTPVGRTGGLYAGNHQLGVNGDTHSVYDGKFLVAFGTPGFATVTNQFGRTLPAGSQVFLQLDRPGVSGDVVQNPGVDRVRLSQDILVDIGQPAAALATGLATSQSIGAGARATLVKTQLDVPRNVVGAWTGSAVAVVRGKDEFGATMQENSALGVVLTGKKAFASIESITMSGAVTAATFGWGNVLGLPVFIDKVTDVIRVSTLTANETTTQTPGVVAGALGTPSANTGDVRGTFTPQAPIAVTGTISYTVAINTFDLYYRGRPQYAG
jgi:hypothetical protein